jgi:hypothetical protein
VLPDKLDKLDKNEFPKPLEIKFEVVGPGVVLQQTPSFVMVEPPSLTIVPPAIALQAEIEVATAVVKVAIPLKVVKVN